MMSQSSLYAKLPEIMELWRVTPKLKMVTHHNIKHKPTGSNAFPLIKEFMKGANLYCIADEDEDDEVGCTSQTLSPLASFLLRVSGTNQCTSP